MEIYLLLEDWVKWWTSHGIHVNTSCVRTQSFVDNSKCLQGPRLLLKARLWVHYNTDGQLLVTSDSTSAPLLSFQENTTLISPASKNHLPKSPASKSILWLCLLGKADWNKHFSSTSTLLCTIIAAAAAFTSSTLILLPRVSSTTASTSYLPFSKSKPQKTSSSTVPERLVFRLPDHHKLITY